ncbi:hypothetical protein DM01DRAFT_1334630 [Hesseltinella vesiculosa]|uniref:F-box domain-containing protein n=1 Tax=Hesseltinella vesiculosa TaxID=101127 RepID=A0A1X2GMI2_9FUNG|nr:hypothetical protein DM01DRAFT_1334630 [Hesseltinella vesiculosa]
MDLDAIQPAPLVTTLTIAYLNASVFSDVWFNYLLRKYISISSLSIELDDSIQGIVSRNPDVTIHSLISSLKRLDTLHLNIPMTYNPRSEIFQVVDVEALRDWLNDNARSPLTSFSWLCPVSPLDRDNRPIMFASAGLVQHLTSFRYDVSDSDDAWLTDCLSHLPAPPNATTFPLLTTLHLEPLFQNKSLFNVDLPVVLLCMPNLLHLTLRKCQLQGSQDPAGLPAKRRPRCHPLQSLHLYWAPFAGVFGDKKKGECIQTLDLTGFVNFCPHLDELLLHNCCAGRILINAPQHSFTRLSIYSLRPDRIHIDQLKLVLQRKTIEAARPSGTLNVIQCKAVDRFDAEHNSLSNPTW